MKSTVRIGIGLLVFIAFATITWTISNNELQAQPLDNLGSQDSMPASQTDNGFLTGPSEGSPVSIAIAYLTGNQSVMGLTQMDLEETAVTETYTKQSDFTQVEFTQQLNGIDVYNGTILVNVAGDGSIINMHNQFVPDLANKANVTAPVLTAEEAVNAAARHLGLTTVNLTVEGSSNNAAQETTFNDGSISRNSIPAKLIYQPMEKEVRLAWDVEIYMRNEDNWWSMRVDAITGQIIDRFNYVIHEDFLEQAQLSHGNAYMDGVQQALPGSFSFPSSAMLANSYRVYEWPVESPNHSVPPNPADGRTVAANPSASASANGSPFGWHSDNTTNWTDTRGNNVTAGKGTTYSECGATLDCNTALDLTLDPTAATNVGAGIDNLFYWNNITHDVWYNYGFDEVNRNFQENNNGQGALGSDSVNANAQASGNCNANFGTPSDGSNPTMNMFNCNVATPSRDGDLDNGVIVHEYAHGISNRLTGGASVSCLSNTEQMGEGWSDWYGLMMTIESGDLGVDTRGIGTWLLGTGPDGPGVRTQKYSTDMGENTHTYADVNSAVIPHGVGEIWATMLWDMTWALIADGSQSGLDLDIYNGSGGNNLAMQLVTDGMKLQPCSPGFVDGRDAILLADQNFTGGANQCVIWEAFAQRGLGASANQGSSGSASDGTEAFDLPAICLQTLKLDKTASPDPAPAGSVLTYTLVGSNDTLGTLTNVVISDTIQTGQTYVPASATCSGNESTGIVTFPLGTLTSGQVMTCTFQVAIDNGISSTEFFFDDFEGGTGNWTTSGLWNSEGEGDTCGAQQAPFPSSNTAFYFGQDGSCTYDTGSTATGSLTMNSDIAIPGGATPILNFSYFLGTENLSGFDEAFVEISTDGGTNWAQLIQVTDSIWQQVSVDMSSYAGGNVRLRFRFDTGDNISNDFFGWLLDDIQIIEEGSVSNTACVEAAEGDNDCDSVTTLVDGISLVTWNGSVDSDWANSTNWTPNQVPNTGISALIPSGPTIWPQISGVAEVLNLTIDADAELSIMDSGSLSVEGVMVNNGRFAQTIATVPASGSRFMHIQNQADAVDKYLGVDITPDTGMTEVTVAIRGHQECTTVAGEAVQRCFEISMTGSDTATIIFHYLESERNSLTASNMEAYHWSGTQPWTLAGIVSSRDDVGPEYSVTLTGVSSFSPFVLAGSVPTAVSLESISANSNAALLPLLIATLLLLLMGGVVLRRRVG